MPDKHKIGSDGLRDDGVRTDQATPQDFMLYGQAQQALSQWSAPVLLHADNPHERLAIINMDGTGNDAVHDPEHITNVGLFNKELEFLSKANPHIHAIYETGPGTQKNIIVRMADGAIGYTYDAHLERAYEKFIKQANKWLTEDPHADIRVSITGFSRGGDEAAGLARLIHERGIQNPSGMMVRHHHIGHGTITYTKPPLVPPGKTLQAVMLLDPVGTGVPYRRDRQLPPSVVSGLQITARDERRDAFASSEIIPNGLSVDGRFLQVTTPGAHSDIGGSYHRNGLSTLNYNLAADYLNALSDTPLLHKRALPQDPQMYVIHHSEDHQWFYATQYVAQHGERALRGAQRSAPHCRATIACLPPESLDPSLATALQTRHAIEIGQDQPTEPQAIARLARSQETHAIQTTIERNAAGTILPLHVAPLSAHRHTGIHPTGKAPESDDFWERVDRMITAADAGDWASFRRDNQVLADMEPAHELWAHAKAVVDMEERSAAEQRSRSSALLRLDDPVHPDHALYIQAREGVHKLDREYDRITNINSDMLAASLVVAARRSHLTAIHEVHLSADRQQVIARDTSSIHTALFHVSINTLDGLNTPMEHSSQQWQQVMHEHAQEQIRNNTRSQSRGMSR